MLYFLRQQRRKIIGKRGLLTYLGYAIGEVVLVVLGILIAVYIDNRNDEEKERLAELALYEDIISDLRRDSVQFVNLVGGAKRQLRSCYHIYQEINGKATYQDTIDYDILAATRTFSPRTARNNVAAIENIKNHTVRDEINDYFFQQDFTQDAVAEFNEFVLNESRPYYFSHNMIDSKQVFHSNMYGFLPQNKTLSNYDDVAARYDDHEFLQIVQYLRVSMGLVIQSLESLIAMNHELINSLQAKLESNN